MRRSLAVFATIAILSGLSVWAHATVVQADADVRDLQMLKSITNSRSVNQRSGLATDWHDCLIRIQSEVDAPSRRHLCKSWTAQGVTTDMVALRLGGDPILMLESRLANTNQTGRLVVDIVGGPGGTPFHSQPGMTEEFIDELRSRASGIMTAVKMKEQPQYQLMKRGYTVASIGYWGTNIRTLNVPNEINLAVADVKNVIDFYRDELGEEPPLVTTSLGNHLALGALGKDRLARMPVLSLVPVMDGLQHHLVRHENEIAEERRERRENGKPFGEWRSMTVYARSGDTTVFDHSRFMPLHEYVPSFIGDADYPWRDVRPLSSCSRTVLGSKDPRTKDYLASNDNLPEFVTVLDSDHDVFKDSLDQTRAIFAEFATCIAVIDE